MKGFTKKLEKRYWNLSYQSRKQLYQKVQKLVKQGKTAKQIEQALK